MVLEAYPARGSSTSTRAGGPTKAKLAQSITKDPSVDNEKDLL